MSATERRGVPHTVRVSSPAHRVTIVAEDRDDVAVEGDARLHRSGLVTSVDGVRGSLQVRVPTGTDVQVGTHSSRVKVRGEVGRLAVTTSSGRVEVETARAADIRTSSGRVEVGAVAEEARLRSASGRVHVGECECADVATDSGRIEILGARGLVRAHCVSGKIEVVMVQAADVAAETVSGRIKVALPAGTRVFQPGAGGPAATRPADSDCTVTARSVSGRVVVSTT